MKGNIVELRLWSKLWGEQVADWYDSGEYPMYFRTMSHPPFDRSTFENFPQFIGHLVFGIFTKELGGPIGLCNAYNFCPNAKTGSAGIMVDSRFQGGGIASDCFLTLGKWMFYTKNLRKVSMEFSGADERIRRLLNRMAMDFDPRIEIESPIERNPFFEGKFKKEMIINGKYVDIIRVGGFKNQFDKLIEKIKGEP